MTQGQTWDPEVYARNARYVVDMGLPVLELLNPQPGERILDLGCGDGVLTLKLIEMGCQVIGVDSSSDQVQAAQTLGIDAHLIPGEELPYLQEFDAVFSNAALHWMKKNPDSVIAGVRKALKPGGRFVAECGGAGNVAKVKEVLFHKLRERGIDPDCYDPWYFPTREEYRAKLESQGFHVEFMNHFPKPMTLPHGIVGWLDAFGLSFLNALPEAEREPLKQEVQDALKDTLRDEEGNWFVDYVRLRFKALKLGE